MLCGWVDFRFRGEKILCYIGVLFIFQYGCLAVDAIDCNIYFFRRQSAGVCSIYRAGGRGGGAYRAVCVAECRKKQERGKIKSGADGSAFFIFCRCFRIPFCVWRPFSRQAAR